MAFSGMGSNGGNGRALSGGGRRRWGGGSLSEMNVVPLVDVVLVLLIIFMITASAMEFGFDIEVPETKQVQNTTEDHPVISIDKQSNLYLNDRAVNINQLAAAIRERFPGEDEVFLRADREVPFELPVQVLAQLGAAGLKPSVVTKVEDIRAKGRRK